MIIKLLLDLIYSLFSVLTAGIQIATTPVEVGNITVIIADLFSTGLSFLGNFVDLSYLLGLFSVILAVDVGLFVYHFVMWILKKIPMIGIQ